jgi:hypothetical protein
MGSTRFNALLTSTTLKFNFRPNSIPVINVEDLRRKHKPFEKVLRLMGKIWSRLADRQSPQGRIVLHCIFAEAIPSL